MKSPPWLPLLIAAAGIFVYANSFSVPFFFDDFSFIVKNPNIRRLWPPWELLQTSTRPVLELSFALNYAIGKLNVTNYHLTNLLIHLCAALTLYGILRRTLQQTWTAFTIALLWTMHPLQTQSVTYLIQRAESLMSLFYLLTLYGLIRGADSDRPREWQITALLTCGLGMATKGIMATAPLALLLYDRTFLAGSFKAAWQKRKGFYLGLAATWLLLVQPLWVTVTSEFRTAGFTVEGMTPLTYVLNQSAVLLHYLRLVFWPNPLVVDYVWQPAPSLSLLLLPSAAAGLLLLAAGWTAWKKPKTGFWAFWFFLILLPTSSIFPLVDLAAEHRTYLPSACILTLSVRGGWALLKRLPFSGNLRGGIAALLVLVWAGALGAATLERNRDYQDPMGMWQDLLKKRPYNARAHSNIGKMLALQGKSVEAIKHFSEAIRLKPDFLGAHNNLGNTLAQEGKLPEAMIFYRKALEIKPTFADAHLNLGNALLRTGEVDQAIVHYRKAVEYKPALHQAHNNLGVALKQLGKKAEALRHFQEALRLNPDDPQAGRNLEELLRGNQQ